MKYDASEIESYITVDRSKKEIKKYLKGFAHSLVELKENDEGLYSITFKDVMPSVMIKQLSKEFSYFDMWKYKVIMYKHIWKQMDKALKKRKKKNSKRRESK